jgi:NADPH:quinone reductase-like Zn-dependent oxidoreductase
MRVIAHNPPDPVDKIALPAVRFIEVDAPAPGPDQVLIKVAYAGVNRPDLLQRRGSYPPPVGACPYMGLEVSGIISAIGANVTQWKVGQEVCALTSRPI